MIRILVSCNDALTYEWIARHFGGSENWAIDDVAVTANAVAKAMELRPDIAIVEISTTDSLERIKRMKSALPNMVIFVVTAQSTLQIESEALSCGAEAVFQADEVASLVANIYAASECSYRGNRWGQGEWHHSEYVARVASTASITSRSVLEKTPRSDLDRRAKLSADSGAHVLWSIDRRD